MASPYETRPTMRGADVKIRLMSSMGAPLDLIAAESVDLHPILAVISSEVLAVGQTQRQTYTDGWEIMVKGVRKGGDFLANIATGSKDCVSKGLPLPKYRGILTYTTRGSDGSAVPQVVKLTDATFTSIDAFASGKMNDKQSEGFTLTGQLS